MYCHQLFLHPNGSHLTALFPPTKSSLHLLLSLPYNLPALTTCSSSVLHSQASHIDLPLLEAMVLSYLHSNQASSSYMLIMPIYARKSTSRKMWSLAN